MAEPTDKPTLTRGHKKKARTRRQLVAAAVDVIAERGEAFSVSDIVARAGVASGTFYNYFTDRDELIGAVVPEVLASFAAESASAVVHEDPALRLAAISALALGRAATSPDEIRAVLRLDAVQKAIIDGGVADHLRDDLAVGVAAGRFEVPPGPAAVDVIVGSLFLAARRIVDGDMDDDYRRDVVTQLLCSLGIPHGEASALAQRATVEADAAHDQQ